MVFMFLPLTFCGGGDDNDDLLGWSALYLLSQSSNSNHCAGINRSSTSGDDTLYSNQWHLNNSSSSDNDLNVESVWSSGIKGNGVRVAVVDDGLEISHEDIKENIQSDGNYNFWTAYSGYGYSSSKTDPSPGNSNDNHGTAVGGIVGALDENGVGVRGAAPRSCLVGYNLIASEGGATSTDEVTALTKNASDVDVSNNSWGPADKTGELSSSTSTWRDAVETGLSSGRNSKGTIYLWAGGNGAYNGSNLADNSNYDGYANYRGVLSICALLKDGTQSSYSENGANLWVCGYGGPGSTDTSTGITTIDREGSSGYNDGSSSSNFSDSNYSGLFNGTSAATPTVAGVVALILEKNSNLTWRDVRLILAESARKNDSSDSDWTTNSGSKIKGSGSYNINHKYGFGAVDADAAVSLAESWTNVASEESPYSYPTDGSEKSVGSNFSDNNSTGASDSITISGSSIKKIEFIEVYLTASSYIADMDVRLTNSNGTESVLAVEHNCSSSTTCSSTFNGWRFGTARHLGEDSNQTWTLTVSDRYSGNVSGGTFTSWSIKFYGRAE